MSPGLMSCWDDVMRLGRCYKTGQMLRDWEDVRYETGKMLRDWADVTRLGRCYETGQMLRDWADVMRLGGSTL